MIRSLNILMVLIIPGLKRLHMFNTQSMCEKEQYGHIHNPFPCIPSIRLLLCMYMFYSTFRNNFICIIIIISCKLVNTHLSVMNSWRLILSCLLITMLHSDGLIQPMATRPASSYS